MVDKRSLDSSIEGLSNGSEGVFAIDHAQRLILWNSVAERLLGFHASEVLGKSCHEVLAGRDRMGRLQCTPHCPLLSAARQGNSIESCDVLMQTKWGQPLWINIRHVVIPSLLRSRFTMVHIFHDVTRQVHAGSLLARLQSLLAEARWPPTGPGPLSRAN